MSMTPEDMTRWIGENPGKVNSQDKRGDTMLTVAAGKATASFIIDLIDTRGANVDGQNSSGRTALFTATCATIISALLRKGADPLLRDRSGWMALMWHAYEGRQYIVVDLLRIPRVIEAIDAQATNTLWEGFSALHIACKAHTPTSARVYLIDQLLRAGANPRLRNGEGNMPLDVLVRHHPYCKQSLSLLEGATKGITYILSKARHQVAALHFLHKVAQDGDDVRTTKEKQAACVKMRQALLGSGLRQAKRCL
jgi:ankyrin repeat protein